MTNSKTLFLLAGAALSMGASAALADNTSVSRDEVRAIVSEMMQDAETRSSLLQGGVTGGHDGKFFLASSNGDFRLNVGGFTQFRYFANFRDDNSTDNEFEPGFQMARVRLEFSGHVVNPNLKFFISSEFSDSDNDSNSTGNFELKDAYVDYSFGQGWGVWAGQGKLPFLKEELISDTKQMAVERGFVNGAFTLGRSQGVGISYVGEAWSMHTMFSDGPNALNTDFGNGMQNGTNTAESDYSLGARFEFKFAGKDLSEFKEFTSKPDSDFAALLGIAANHSASADTAAAGDTDTQYSTLTADFTLKTAGLSFYVAGVVGLTDQRAAGADTDFTDYGIVAQIAYRFGQWEPFARYDGLFYDSDRALTEDTQNFITIGVNDYLAGQAAKLTLDAVFVGDDVTLTGVAPGAGSGFSQSQGLLPSADDGQIAIRAQFQLMF